MTPRAKAIRRRHIKSPRIVLGQRRRDVRAAEAGRYATLT